MVNFLKILNLDKMFLPLNRQRYYLRLPSQDYSWSEYQQRIQPQQIWSNQQQTLKTTNMIEPTTNNKKQIWSNQQQTIKKTNMIEPTTNNNKKWLNQQQTLKKQIWSNQQQTLKNNKYDQTNNKH